jgi:phycocyanobilin:ferredoxin oxidoreductase
MNAWRLMAQAAVDFRVRLRTEPGCRALASPLTETSGAGLQWDNLLLTADRFRRAHVELFMAAGRVCVLHVVVLPHLDDASPIFGFDMIAGPARVTGIFLDLSPVTHPPAGLRLREAVEEGALANFASRREVPPWGDIFSTDFLAVRPIDLAEVRRAIGLGGQALDAALSAPRICVAHAQVRAGQDRYASAQRRNEHTFRMLAGLVGHAPARRFIDDILFPSIQQATSLLDGDPSP